MARPSRPVLPSLLTTSPQRRLCSSMRYKTWGQPLQRRSQASSTKPSVLNGTQAHPNRHHASPLCLGRRRIGGFLKGPVAPPHRSATDSPSTGFLLAHLKPGVSIRQAESDPDRRRQEIFPACTQRDYPKKIQRPRRNAHRPGSSAVSALPYI